MNRLLGIILGVVFLGLMYWLLNIAGGFWSVIGWAILIVPTVVSVAIVGIGFLRRNRST